MTMTAMKPDDFRNWRKGLGWKQKDAADRLGLKKRVIQYYEKGARDGKEVEIPKTVELACLALALGFEHYDGQPVERAANAPAPAAVSEAAPADDEPVIDMAAEAVAPVAPVDEEAVAEEAAVKKPRRLRKKG